MNKKKTTLLLTITVLILSLSWLIPPSHSVKENNWNDIAISSKKESKIKADTINNRTKNEKNAVNNKTNGEQSNELTLEKLPAAENQLNASKNKKTLINEQYLTFIKNFQIPEYKGEMFIILNNNQPLFNKNDLIAESFENYQNLDYLSRAQTAEAILSLDTMPVGKRKSISHIKPSGWKQNFINGDKNQVIFNRSHLIGFSLSAENDNVKNIITGTATFNQKAMTIFEEMVLTYIKKTSNHVAYRVTPIYLNDELIARGIIMEAESVEDNGEGISYCVYIFNNETFCDIDYKNGNVNFNINKDLIISRTKVLAQNKKEIAFFKKQYYHNIKPDKKS